MIRIKTEKNNKILLNRAQSAHWRRTHSKLCDIKPIDYLFVMQINIKKIILKCVVEKSFSQAKNHCKQNELKFKWIHDWPDVLSNELITLFIVSGIWFFFVFIIILLKFYPFFQMSFQNRILYINKFMTRSITKENPSIDMHQSHGGIVTGDSVLI